MSIQRSSRIIDLYLLLKSKSKISAYVIAEELNINIRTVYRDIAKLQNLGVQISGSPGPEGGYSIENTHVFNPFILGDDEALMLYLIANENIVNRGPLHEKYEKVLSDFQSSLKLKDDNLLGQVKSRIYFDTNEWYWNDFSSPITPQIRQAVFEQKYIVIEYMVRGGDKKQQKNKLAPLGIVWKGGQWYIVGEVFSSKEISRIRISRIISFELTNQTFIYPNNFHLQTWWKNELERFGKGDIEIILEVSPTAKEELLTLSFKENSVISERPDGSLLITLFVDNWDWLVPLILSYGDNVVIIKPQSLKNKLVSLLKSALNNYLEGFASRTEEDASIDDNKKRASYGRRHNQD